MKDCLKGHKNAEKLASCDVCTLHGVRWRKPPPQGIMRRRHWGQKVAAPWEIYSSLYQIPVICCFRSPQPPCLWGLLSLLSSIAIIMATSSELGCHQSPRLGLHSPAHRFFWWGWGVIMGRPLELRLITHKGWGGLIPQGKNLPSVHDRRRIDLSPCLPRWIVLRSSYYVYLVDSSANWSYECP